MKSLAFALALFGVVFADSNTAKFLLIRPRVLCNNVVALEFDEGNIKEHTVPADVTISFDPRSNRTTVTIYALSRGHDLETILDLENIPKGTTKECANGLNNVCVDVNNSGGGKVSVQITLLIDDTDTQQSFTHIITFGKPDKTGKTSKPVIGLLEEKA